LAMSGAKVIAITKRDAEFEDFVKEAAAMLDGPVKTVFLNDCELKASFVNEGKKADFIIFNGDLFTVKVKCKKCFNAITSITAEQGRPHGVFVVARNISADSFLVNQSLHVTETMNMGLGPEHLGQSMKCLQKVT